MKARISSIFALLIGLHNPSYATTAELAFATAGADAATTAAALSAGLVELNPLGPIGSIVAKGLAIGFVQVLPKEEQPYHYNLISSFWGGAAASNLCWLTGVGPVCYLLGLAAGSWIWRTGDSELKLVREASGRNLDPSVAVKN